MIRKMLPFHTCNRQQEISFIRHVTHNEDTGCTLGEGWRLGRACRRQSVTGRYAAEVSVFCSQHGGDGG